MKYNVDVNLGVGEEMLFICVCLKKYLKVVKELFKKGVNVNYKDIVGNIILIVVILNFFIKYL